MYDLNTQQTFRRLLIRNILFPLMTGLFTSAVLVFLITTLMNENKDVLHSEQVIAVANSGIKSFLDGETGMRGFALTGKENFLEPYVAAKENMPRNLTLLKELVKDNPVQSNAARDLEALSQSWTDYAERIIKLRKDNKNTSAVISQGLGKSIMDKSREYFDKIMATEEHLRKERMDAVNSMTQIVLIAMVSLSLVISVLLALYGRRQMLTLSGAYENILKTTQDQNHYLQQQQWIKTGQSELTEKMTTQKNLSDLGDILIAYTATYLKAQVGAFYLVTHEQTLALAGTFACAPEDIQHKTIRFGETLIGQVAVEKKILKVSHVPDDYIKVSSAVGSSRPTELLLVPIADENKQLLGILELGFFGSIDPRAKDFFEVLNESIATSINSALFRDQREKLLREIQNQTEELQTQQEELRAMNEELEEQTRMLKTTQTRLEAQHAEMEQTNAQLEEQTRTLESQKDLLDRRNDSLVEAKLSLEQKALELQRASQYKSEFLANMSHELRTPLNSSLILAKLLADNKERNLNRQQIEFAQQILNSGNDLLNLINDILDLSKVESGKLDIHPESVSIEHLIKNLEKVFTPMAQEKGLKIHFQRDVDTPSKIYTDPLRVEQILKNLLSNAVKFTTQGAVNLRVQGDTEWIHFEVQDTGIGIKPEHQGVIFEAFRQADGTTNRKFGGTGLGLSISRDLARLLGGQIKVQSQMDVGSTFTFSLPTNYKESVVTSESLTPPAPSVIDPKKEMPVLPRELFLKDDREELLRQDERHILVVEDDKNFAQILFDLTRELKYKCIVTNTAEEAVELAQRFHPSAVILDVKLKGQSGLFVLDQLKQNTETRHIPVHVISGEDFSRQALRMGAIDYTLKPVRREQLIEAFEKIEAKISQHIRKVLVIEDNKIQREAIQKLIEDKSLETRTADTGAAALKILEEVDFDCIIMDLNLPEMSGFELLEKLNSRTENTHKKYPPIIIYTGRSLSREEEVQLQHYSRSVIIKGAKSPERLLDEVTLFLHRVESNLDKNKQDMLENLRNREKIFEDKSILIVDDDMRNTFALTAALEQKGAKIVIARNGEESLTKLKESTIDIVLMDIMMPIMDGFEATRRIRQNPKFKKLPIIALTAKATKDDHQLCLQAGANDYLSKPVDLDKLLSLIRIWLTAGWS